MKKIIFYGLVFLSLIIIISFSQALSQSQISQCKSNCQSILSNLHNCQSDFKSCSSLCVSQKISCLNASKMLYSSCTSSCSNSTDATCLVNCRAEYRKNNALCSDNACKKACNSEKRFCLADTKYRARQCSNSCSTGLFNNSTLPRDIIHNYSISEEYCLSNNGTYQQLCNGPYFDIKCSQKSFCICSGETNNLCPPDYTCSKNFSISGVPPSSIPGWKTLLGKSLGDIGICEKKNLATCGNGICESAACLSVGCPDPENSLNCPSDCQINT